MKSIIAIDPGALGGIAVKNGDHFATAIPMPQTEGDIIEVLSTLKDRSQELIYDRVAYVEDQVGCVGPGMRVSGTAMFKFGRGFGFLLGVLQTQRWRIVLVRPQKWQAALSLGSKKDSGGKTPWKNKLKQRAQQLYPQAQVTLKTADALLLLEYARKVESK